MQKQSHKNPHATKSMQNQNVPRSHENPHANGYITPAPSRPKAVSGHRRKNGDGSGSRHARWWDLIGSALRHSPTTLPDRAALRRTFGPRGPSDPRPPESVRINVDMSTSVVLMALVWALVADGSLPTLTVHGSNNPSFYTDTTVRVTRTMSYNRGLNTHTLGFDADLLWQLHVPTTAAISEAHIPEVYLVRMGSGVRYTQLNQDGSVMTSPYTGFDGPDAHVFPLAGPVPRGDPPPYRYYALTLSVGSLQSNAGHVIELQEWQPLVHQPAPAIDISSCVVYGRLILPTTESLYRIRLTKELPPGGSFGYMELWDTFRVRAPFRNGSVWSTGSLATRTNDGSSNRRYAIIQLVDVIVPRTTIVRSLNGPITSVPFVWCFVRHPSVYMSEDQSALVVQTLDPDRLIVERLRPPSWIHNRNTMRFMLSVPNARIPCDCPFVNLPSSGSVRVHILGSIFTSLPEICMVLPNGEMLDLVMYEDNCLFPVEVDHDENSGINILLMVDYEERMTKRVRV